MFRTVKNWLTLLVVGIVALAMLAAWAYVVPPFRGRLVEQKLDDARDNARLISETMSQWVSYDPARGLLFVPSVNRTALNNTMNTIAARVGGRVILYTRNLVPRKDSGGPDPLDVADYPMLEKAVNRGRVVQGVVVTSSGRVAATAVPLYFQSTGDTVIAAVLVISSLEDVDNAVDAVQRQLLFATVLALGISLLLGYMASFFIAGRLKRIERSAEAIAGGDLTAKVPETVEDEIGQLADTFNVMADRLRSAFAQVEYERDRVEVLLNDLSEGVIGLSGDGTVTIANPAAAGLLDTAVLVGEHIGEALPADVANLWRESREDGDAEILVFVHGAVTLEATTYPVGGGADFTSIIVLRDVTAQARLDRARRDLIANASHEFKTPLFSLAGSLELIDEGELSPEEQREFLQIMRQQVDRLRNMAVSMLDLSRVESGSFELHPEDVGLVELARSVLDEFQAQTQSKEVVLTIEGDTQHTAWCDEERLAQVLRALIDNAVKYSRSGRAVRVATAIEGEEAVVIVEDDGPGIPGKELPHVFERFHRGREERATTTGAGLGLSIARELTEMMGGRLTAESPAGGGARFIVHLPRSPGRRRGAAS